MSLHNFVFSNESRHRIARHLLLWTSFSAYFFVVNFFPRSSHDFIVAKTYTDALRRMVYIPIAIYSVYFSIYILLPRFLLKAKYVRFFIAFIALSVINVLLAYAITNVLMAQSAASAPPAVVQQMKLFQAMIYGFGLGTASSAFAVIVKLLKIRFLKQKENELLQQQKIDTELQLIKSNFHPHFLADALQNIFELIQQRSPKSPLVILKLSDLLSYLLYENKEEAIPVKKELAMIRDYLDLEKTFYGNRIVVNRKGSGDMSNMHVAPLLLLSLVQNCCEQFLISLQQKLVIDLETIASADGFIFRLGCNGYYENIHGMSWQNTDLNKALRRISFLYPGTHQLTTHSDHGVFFMELKLNEEAVFGKGSARQTLNPSYETV